MPRLTERDSNGDVYVKQHDYVTAADKLAEYEDLEEQGLLLRLLQYAYFIKDNKVQEGWVQQVVYSVCRKPLLDIRYDDCSLDSYRGYVGNDVFLTKEEAEAKLRKMEVEECTQKQ